MAARKRAARVGDGWLPLFVEPDHYRHDLDRLAEDVAAGGRAPGSVTPAIVLFVSVDDDPGTALHEARGGCRRCTRSRPRPSNATW